MTPTHEVHSFADLPAELAARELAPHEIGLYHWTPEYIAEEAARLLVTRPGTRVLDVGCGIGQFCMAGAEATEGYFTGVEQRGHLVTQARRLARERSTPRVRFVHANITTVPFWEHHAFYLFNPFDENLRPAMRIDSAVELSGYLFESYNAYVKQQLSEAPAGTRVVTYVGGEEALPEMYREQERRFGGQLVLWVKGPG